MGRRSDETRAVVLDVARELFYWHGIHATGVDRIAREAGIAPTTLYRLFASKDELVAAYVQREAEGYIAWFTAAVDSCSDSADRILALFEALSRQVALECRGCPFQMALAETPDSRRAGHTEAVAIKEWTRAQFGYLVDQLPTSGAVTDRSELADQLMLILEGVYAIKQSRPDAATVRSATALVRRLITPTQP